MIHNDKTCALCGHGYDLNSCGHAFVNDDYLCHDDSHSCYHLWTVWKVRTLNDVVRLNDNWSGKVPVFKDFVNYMANEIFIATMKEAGQEYINTVGELGIEVAWAVYNKASRDAYKVYVEAMVDTRMVLAHELESLTIEENNRE